MADSTLGSRLRARRTDLGLTLAQVRDRSGLSLPYISNLERDRGNPTLDALRSLADALGATVGELTGDGESVADAVAPMPDSLRSFIRSELFERKAAAIAEKQDVPPDEMKSRLVDAMRSAPRRSSSEPTPQDWQRLLDVYTLILDEPE